MSEDLEQPVLGPESMAVAPGIVVSGSVLRFTFSRSSGPGGQNVNKRSTKAELRVALDDLPLTTRVRERLVKQAGAALTDAGELVLTSDEHRSQLRNRTACLARLRALLVQALIEPRPRRATRPSKGAVERRLEAKHARARTKQQRREPE